MTTNKGKAMSLKMADAKGGTITTMGRFVTGGFGKAALGENEAAGRVLRGESFPPAFEAEFTLTKQQDHEVDQLINMLKANIKACRMIHIPSGKTALVQRCKDGLCVAQFNEFDHPHSHGWHLYLRRDFKRYE